MKLQRIIAVGMSITMLATTSVTANSANYYYAGNQAMADGIYGSDSAIFDNIGNLATDLFVPIDELSVEAIKEYVASEGMSELIDSVMGEDFSDVVEYVGACYYAYKDLNTALNELSRARQEEYEAMVSAHYTIAYNGCIKLAKSALNSGISGKVINESNLVSAQTFIDDCEDEVAYLRKMANKYKFRNYKHGIRNMANQLEGLYKNIDLVDIYKSAYAVYQDSLVAKNTPNYEYIYNGRTIGTSGALAVVGMAHGMLKGSRTSEHDVYKANQYREDIYWWCTESALGLDDQVTKFGDGVGTTDKISRLISLADNAQSGLVVQVNKSNGDQLRYLLAVGGSNGDLLVLDPISGSSTAIGLKQLCVNYNLDYNNTVGRIRSVWSYALY